jgi:nucleoid-associated protein YgaU
VVVKGDTLWDIAETYVKDPFRYPELAELSKIKNPDLIYPYDLVRIRIYE